MNSTRWKFRARRSVIYQIRVYQLSVMECEYTHPNIYIYISRHQKYSSHLTRTPNPSTRRARRASSFDAQKLRQYHVIWYRREHTQISAICSHTKWTHVKNLHVELQHLYKAVLNIPWTVCASRWWCRVTCLFHGNRSGLGLMVFGRQTHEIFVA